MNLRRALTVIAILLGVCMFIVRANGYELYIVALVGLTTIVGVGLNVLLGMTGQISLGHAAFYAIGAYVVGILTTKLHWRGSLPVLPASYWLSRRCAYAAPTSLW
jgi:ABC-type branched-subunit amino acid transport system permease subunit